MTCFDPAVRVMNRRALIWLVAATAAFFFMAPSMAQDLSGRHIRIISAFPVGIGPDVTMRALAEQLAKQTGRNYVVDPQPGGNGLIAISAFKQAPADGNTLLLVSNAHLSIVPVLTPNVPYNVQRDFVPVGTLYRAPFFLTVNAESKYRTLRDLFSAAKSGEDRVSYSIAYIGAVQHLGIEMLGKIIGAKMLPVPYKDGGMTSVAKGEVDFSFSVFGSLRPFLESGKLRVLAVSSLQRSELMPEVPTVEEAGGPKSYQLETFVGLVAPRGTPPSVIQAMNEQIARAQRAPELIDRYHRAGVSVLSSTTEQMAALMRDDAARVIEQVRRTGVKAE